MVVEAVPPRAYALAQLRVPVAHYAAQPPRGGGHGIGMGGQQFLDLERVAHDRTLARRCDVLPGRLPPGRAQPVKGRSRASSSLATPRMCTASGPSTMRSVRALA